MAPSTIAVLLPDAPEGALDPNCPGRVVLDHVTSKWGVLVLVALDGRILRWGELRRTVEGISEKMLAQTLRTLEGDGFVDRQSMDVIPPHVEYSLTPLGDDLVAHLKPLVLWILDHAADITSHTSPV